MFDAVSRQRRGSKASMFEATARRRASREGNDSRANSRRGERPPPRAPTVKEILEGVHLHGFEVETFVAKIREEMENIGLTRAASQRSPLRRASTMSAQLMAQGLNAVANANKTKRDSLGQRRTSTGMGGTRRASQRGAGAPAPSPSDTSSRSPVSKPAAPSSSSPKPTRWAGSKSPQMPRPQTHAPSLAPSSTVAGSTSVGASSQDTNRSQSGLLGNVQALFQGQDDLQA